MGEVRFIEHVTFSNGKGVVVYRGKDGKFCITVDDNWKGKAVDDAKVVTLSDARSFDDVHVFIRPENGYGDIVYIEVEKQDIA